MTYYLQLEFAFLRLLGPFHTLPIILLDSEFWNSQQLEKKKISNIIQILSFLIDNKLQVKFGTKRTKFGTRSSVIAINPIPTTLDNDLSTIWTKKFLELGLHVWNRTTLLVIWLDALEYIIQGLCFPIWVFKATEKLPF